MVKINLPLKKSIILLGIFFIGFYAGYLLGKCNLWENVFNVKKGNKIIKSDKEIPQKEIRNFPPNQIKEKKSSKLEKQNKKKSIICKININTAKIEELTKLPRIGKKIAQNIINYRKQHGPFKDINELLKIKRIGPKTLNRIKDMITLGNN